jgi:hypothetical protein
MSIKRGGHTFKGLRIPIPTRDHPTKSHAVLVGTKESPRLIRFGEQGAKTNQNAAQRKSFKARHRKNIAKGETSAAYWANKVKW